MERLRLATTLPADPADVYAAWLSGALHAEMTGAPATSEAKKGGVFTAWDGYITGKHVVLEPGKRIVQTWRTTEFPSAAPDSTLEIRLSKAGKGVRIALLQSDIPDGQSDQYAEGWVSHYFDPMTAYFAKMKRARPAKKKTPKRAGEKKAAKGTGKKKTAKGAATKKAAKRTTTKKIARPATKKTSKRAGKKRVASKKPKATKGGAAGRRASKTKTKRRR